jgi:hypothetical protein
MTENIHRGEYLRQSPAIQGLNVPPSKACAVSTNAA